MKNFLAVLLTVVSAGAAFATRIESCPATAQVQLAPTGCRLGSAVAAVDPVDGASYSWTIQGGTLVSGAGTDHILIALGSGQTVKVSVIVNSPACGVQNGTALMALQDPFTVTSFAVTGRTHAGQARTITWSYQNGEPVSQILTGSDFAQPVVLAGAARSYTYTPSMYGDKSVVLSASMVPLPARTHAAGRGGAPSSSCGSARAEAKFHVDCNTPDATISAPQATGVGLPFTASVKLPAGTSASWSITNGSPSTATGPSVTIMPSSNVPVGVDVVVSADTCTAEATAQVKVDSALGCAVVPQATLSLASADCDKGVISVRLTGTPPFSGTWSDGAPFSASGFTAERTVTAAADYTIKRFSDAYCPGQAGTLKVALKPTATLSTSGSTCVIGGNSTAVITFTGTPPFLGEWSDNVAFNTTSARLERKVTQPTDLTLKWFQDAQCDGVVSGHAAFGTPGTASVRLVSPANGCLTYGNDPGIAALVAVDLAGTPPFTVTWGDGVVQNVSGPLLTRYFAPPRGHYAITVAGARDAFCDLTLLNPTVTIGATTAPQISLNGLLTVCPGQDTDARLVNDVAIVGQTVTWRIDHGTIKAGQGTPQVTFAAANDATAATLSVDVADPNTCTATASIPVPFPPPPGQTHITANPSTITLGQSTTLTVTMDDATNFTQVNENSPTYQFLFLCNSTPTCTYVFKPASRGTYDLEAFTWDWCPSPSTHASITVTVQ